MWKTWEKLTWKMRCNFQTGTIFKKKEGTVITAGSLDFRIVKILYETHCIGLEQRKAVLRARRLRVRWLLFWNFDFSTCSVFFLTLCLFLFSLFLFLFLFPFFFFTTTVFLIIDQGMFIRLDPFRREERDRECIIGTGFDSLRAECLALKGC